MTAAREWLWFAIVLAGTPLLQLAINPNLFVNPATNLLIDPWIYSGYFLSLTEQVRLFPDTYYGSRLSVILPGFLAHRLLPPLPANYLLHLGYFSALLAATYLLVRRGLDAGAGLLTMIVMAWNPIVLSALGWDYVDGAGIVFLVAALLCLESAVGAGRRRHGWSAAAGALIACLVTGNIFLIVFVPLLALFVALRARGRRERTAPVAVVAALGAVGAFAVFGLVNVGLGGAWNFLAPQFREGQTLASARNPWQIAGYGWLLYATWLVLPMMAALGAALSIRHSIRTRAAPTFAFALHGLFLAAAFTWLVIQIGMTPVLQISYYSSYLAPLAVLSLSMHVVGREEMPSGSIHGLAIAGVVIFAAGLQLFLADTRQVGAWLESAQRGLPYLARVETGHRQAAAATFIAAAAAIATVVFVRAASRFQTRWIVLSAGLSLTFVAAPQFWQSATGAMPRVRYAITAAAHRYISGQVDGRRLRIWYDLPADTERPVKSIASTFLWGYVLVNEALPQLTPQQAETLTEGTRLVILAPDAADVALARAPLGRFGFEFRPVAERRFGDGGAAVAVVVGDLVRSAGTAIQQPDRRGQRE